MQPDKPDTFTMLKQNKKILLAIIGGVFLLIMLVVTIAAYTRDPTPGQVVALQTHLRKLSEFAREQNDDILNGGDLIDQSENFAILGTGAANDISAVALERWGEVAPDPEALAVYGARQAELETAMATAFTTNTVDTEYQKLMVAELEFVDGHLERLSAKSSRSVSEVLESVRGRLEIAKKSLADVKL